MARGRLPEMKTLHSGKRLYAAQTGDEIRLAIKQGRRGIWRRFELNFSAANPADGCRALTTLISEAAAKDWAFESPSHRWGPDREI